ncbi:ABC transporter substrate-binding protein [bacterium]|nr:ABC transporter substrate-binding protein [bacterium]MCI0601722.1 ABC transporter substrate-binding protein [bacterium]
MKYLSVILAFVLFSCSKQDELVVASKNFSEQVILGELLSQHIEQTLKVPVERKLNLGGTFICHNALIAGQIDVYVEYTGTAYTAILKREPKNNPKEVLAETKAAYRDRGISAEWTSPLGFNNTFAMIIRGEDARRLGIKTISESAKYTPQWKAGFGYEFMERKDGFPGLSDRYGLKFAETPKIMDLTLTYKAVAEKQVDFIAGNSTDGLIAKLDLFVLEDDRYYFPPYQAAPVVRIDTLKRFPGLREALNQLGGKITEKEMRQMNYAVDVEHRDVKQVVADFLKRRFPVGSEGL